MHSRLLALSILLACGAASAQVTVPNTFNSGTPAKAGDVNANFQALAGAINALSGRVAKLEGQLTMADLAGTYTLTVFQTELGQGSNRYVATYTSQGTVTLAANGTGTISGLTESGSELNVTTGVRAIINRPQGAGNFSWSYGSGAVAMLGGSFAVTSGGALMVRASANTADGTNVILLLTRR